MSRYIDADKLKGEFLHFTKGSRDVISIMTNVVPPMIDKQPTVDAKPVVHGEWFWEKICDNPPRPICSKCFDEPYRKNNVELPNYCPTCGAKMDGGSSL